MSTDGTALTHTMTLEELICRTWDWDSQGQHQIKFNADGTGELTSRAELNMWIAAYTSWRFAEASDALRDIHVPHPHASPSHISSWFASAPENLATTTLEVTLTKRWLPVEGQGTLVDAGTKMNELILKDSAYEPKTYSIYLEKGTFYTQADTSTGETTTSTQYGLRLSFSDAPYPREEEWKDAPAAGTTIIKQWDMTQFCSAPLHGSGCIIM